jgi:hypothetical protein
MAQAQGLILVGTSDDGDEKVFISVGDKIVFEVNHDEHGWDGMEAAIGSVKAVVNSLAESGLDVKFVNSQDVV